MKRWLAALCVSAGILSGCGHTGFVELAEPMPPKSPAEPIPIYVSRDIGQPYRVIGYVFRSTEGHKSGLQALDDRMHVMMQGSEELSEIRRQALARGADAIVGLEMFPTINAFGQPSGFSVGGLAVKLEAPSSAPASPPSVPSPSSSTPAPSDTAPPNAEENEAPLEEPEPAPADQPPTLPNPGAP